MAKVSKRLKAIRATVEANKLYALDEAIALVKKAATAKFDESIDVSFNLGVDPRKSDQVIRGSVVLPKGTGKTTRVAVFTQGANADAAKAAGADIVGFEDLAEEIKKGNMDFDVVIASPDAMRIVAEGVNKMHNETTSAIVITHYERLLEMIKPDVIHVLYKGRIVKTAGPELAKEIETRGYDWIKEEVDAED